MLKILINNEEVVCDKQLEIKEEMLSTSSCILNNCYPKSWENTKDYTTQYYYPKDYSKCVIKDEVNIPAEEGEYATGTNLNINVDNTKEWNYQLQGDTQQNTSILPSGYTQVDYIESHHAEYIDTGYYPNPNSRIESIFQFTQVELRQQRVFGNIHTDTDGLSVNIYINGSGKFAWACQNGVGNWKATTLNADTNKHKFILDAKNNKFYIDDYEENISTTHSNTAKTTLLLLVYRGINGNIESNTKAYGKLYSTKIYDNNVLVRDFIPCYRNSDNVVGLYDLVNNVFYTNQGTGAFTYGSAINIPNPDYPQDIEVVTGEQNVEIVGKNLFDKESSIVNGQTFGSRGNLLTNANFFYQDKYIPVKPLTTYAVSKTATSNSIRICEYTNKKTFIKRDYEQYTFTTTENTYFIRISNRIEALDNLQLERGSIATPYEPYQSQTYPINLGDIELCKIGDYQDYIYNQNGEWYLHKEIGKVILNGSENWQYPTSGNNYTFFQFNNLYFEQKYGVRFKQFSNSTGIMFSNRFKNISGQNSIMLSQEGIGIYNQFMRISVESSKATTITNFEDWLSNNNTEVYFILETPIDTQITDTTLIQQLDNLKNATLYNGVNNISVSGDLPSILNLHYNFVTARIDTTLLFSGVVKNTGNINLNPRYPHYCNLEVLDFKTFLSECDQLDFVINNKTITEAIEQVTQAVASYGFVVGNININDNTIIGAYSTQEKTPYDVFQYLADISQSRWYTRLVDENTVAIDFYDPTAMERGIDLDFSNNTFACQNNVEDLSFNYGTYDYRNKQIMLSNQVFGGVDFEETIIADGYNKIFNTTTPIGILKGITINGSSATFATNEDKEMGVEADFYYTPGNTQIESNENDGTYPANTIIIVGYTPLVKGRQVISDTTEIGRIATQTGRNGTISRYEKRNDVLSSDELELIGNSYLKYKGTPEINLTLVTKDVDLYNIGQIVYFNYPNIEDLSQDYMVKSKRTRIINTATDWNIWYSYTLTSNFNSENAINYFDNQRAKSTGNIQMGDYITRNVDIENSCMIIFSNPSATEITITDNNILNAPLDAPFIK